VSDVPQAEDPGKDRDPAQEQVAPQQADASADAARPKGSRRRAAWRWTRRIVFLVIAIVAGIVLTLVTIDVGRISVGGRSLQTLAESQASKFLKRPMHIGQLVAFLRPGYYELRDVVIEGPTPADRPFFKAARIRVRLPWSSVFSRRLFVEVELADWQMVVEGWPDGSRLPNLKAQPRPDRGPSSFTTTVRVSARGGQFIYDDHVNDWGVTAPNLSFDLVRAENIKSYVGTAEFKGGTVRFRDFLPMSTDFRTRYVLDGGVVRLQHIDLVTDGAVSHVNGYVNFNNWPEQEYNVHSTVQFARMRELFFAGEPWRLTGQGEFRGLYKFFKGGRELRGEFESAEAGIDIGTSRWRFPRLHGALEWLPDRFRVTHADSAFLGGTMALEYGIERIGQAGGSLATFKADYTDVDLYGLTRQFNWTAVEPDGRMTGNVRMAWPNGRFGEGMQGEGHSIITPLDGASIATPEIAFSGQPIPEEPGEFQKFRPLGRFAVGGDLTYRFSRRDLEFDESWVATPSTHVRFSGRARGGPADMPMRATSHDWQASDRLFAAIMSQFSSPTGGIPVGGRGTFDGRLTESFTAPRIEGRFTGDAMRAWGVVWGSAAGDVVIKDSYLDIRNGRFENGRGGVIRTTGRYSLGYPRKDKGEEINSTVSVEQWPLADLRHAFGLDDWPVDGRLALAELTLRGGYETLQGDGRMRLEEGVAWDEPFEWATGDLVFEGNGLRVNRIAMAKGPGRVTGNAWLSWLDGTYSFAADGVGVPVESLANFKFQAMPLTGMLQFKARGAGEFAAPTFEFDARIADLYAGDEGIGEVRGRLTLRDKTITIDQLDAVSNRLQVFGSGTIERNEFSDAKLFFRFFETSLDPYLRFVAPAMSPYTRAIASGTVSVTGALADTSQLNVVAQVEDLRMTLLDYALRNDGRITLAFENDVFKVDRLKLAGQDTSLDVSGEVDAAAKRVNMAASGEASLAILQLFYPDLNTSGGTRMNARLVGPFDAMALSGEATVTDGLFRHQALPHALRELNGPIRIEDSRVVVDGLRGQLGGGDVRFGGDITLGRGYQPEEFNLTADGTLMNLRYPADIQSTVNASLALRGPVTAPVLSGDVDVIKASYVPRIQAQTGLLGLAGGAVAAGPAPPIVEEPSGFPLALDIRVVAGVMPLIENSIATIYGSADIDVTGTLDRPIITGAIEIDRGEVFFSGNRLIVRPGSIDFTNPLRFEPFFDVEAFTRVRASGQSFDITVRATGTFDKIAPTITSEPWLSEWQAISLLLGEQPDVREAELQARGAPQELQAQALRTATVALLTSPISGTIGSVVERTLPIDTVQIVPLLGNEATLQQLNPAARVTLGKRLSNRIYLTYSRTFAAAQNEVILIEFDQSDRVSWVLSRNEDRTFALDFRIRYVF